MARNHVVEHGKLHSNWQCLKKNINRSSAINLSYQEKLCERLNDLFDIAHQVTILTIKIEEAKLLLLAQREKSRRGRIGGVHKALALKEEQALKRKIAAEKYLSKVISTGATTSLPLCHELEAGTSIPKAPKTQKARGTVDIVTTQVAAALDRTNISDRKAAHICL